MQKIYLLDIKGFSDEERLKSLLPPYAVKKAEGYADRADRIRSLFGSMLIEGFTAQEPILLGVHGKPYKKTPPFFNISHSGDKVGIFLSSDGEVGFDIQLIKPPSEKLKNYIFSAEERKFINSDKDFTKFWTMKESAAKCIGVGLRNLKSQTFKNITAKTFTFGNETLYYKNYIDGEYAVSLCSYTKINAKVLNINCDYMIKTLAKKEKDIL